MKPTGDPKRLLAEMEQALHSVPLNRALVFDLILRGADPNFQKKAGDESFFSEFLCEWSDSPVSLEAVELLLEAGANPNHDPGDGMRPLANAYWGRRPDMVALLLRHGADPNFIIEHDRGPGPSVHFRVGGGQIGAGNRQIDRRLPVGFVLLCSSFSATFLSRVFRLPCLDESLLSCQ